MLIHAVQIYGALSVCVAILIAAFGLQRMDPSARGWHNLGYRLVIIPGLFLFWPWLINRAWRGTPPPVEVNAHRLAARP